MTDMRNDFDSRVRSLGRKHRALSKGAVTKLRKDGLIVLRPTRRRRSRGFPLRIVAFVVIGFFGFKGFLLSSIGAAGYEERIATLQAGTAFERVGAEIMKPDRVSEMFAQVLDDLTDT